MVDQVVHPRLDALGCAEVHAVHLAHGFDLLPRARQADQAGVEFLQVGLQHRGRVAGGVAGDEDGEEGRVGGVGGWDGDGDEVEHLRHFVKLLRADVWAVGEAEVDLEGGRGPLAGAQMLSQYNFWCVGVLQHRSAILLSHLKLRRSTHQAKATLHLLLAVPLPPILVYELEFASDLGLPDTLGRLGDALSLHTLLLRPEVVYHADAGGQEDPHGHNGERLERGNRD